MQYRRTIAPIILLAFIAFSARATAQEPRAFSPEIALDVQNVGIADVTADGRRVAVTVQTRRDRTDVDHMRYGDPTYVSPVSTRLMVVDTRTGDQTWVHPEPARLRSFTWSPEGVSLVL